MQDIDTIVELACKVRKRILGASTSPTLSGWCAIASLMLCTELNNLSSFRATDFHAWNRFGDTIVDITATQFLGQHRNEDMRRNVLVTTQPLWFHFQTPSETEFKRRAPRPAHAGLTALKKIANGGWYDPNDENSDPSEIRHWQRALKHWRHVV